ncbi:hypothetical protein Tco_0236727 [Tanacetum coccineum]
MFAKLDKALYGLKQVSRAWYETLSTYFLRFQIEQSERGILIIKERYVKDLLRMYDKIGSSVNTSIVPPNMLGPNLNGKAVNASQYRAIFSTEDEDIGVVGCYAIILWIISQLTDYDIIYEKDKPSFKRFIVELGMLNIDSKPEASVLTEEN